MTCDLCEKTVKRKDSSTTNLFQHLEREHPKEYSSVAPTSKRSAVKRKADVGQGQRTLTSMLPYDRNSNCQNQLVEAVTKFLVSGYAPIWTVDKPSFRNLVKQLDPRFACPSRKFFTDKAIPEMYNSMKAGIVGDLEKITSYSATMDGWSSIAGDPYLSLSVHYIDADWQLQTKCLSTMYIPASHTAATLGNFLKDGLAEYVLYLSNLVAVTTDSAANNIAACRDLSITRVSCFGHILHNALTTTISKSEQTTNLLKATRRIVSVFSYSHESRKKLLKVKKEQKNCTKSLVQDVSTRWGSKYKMLNRLHDQLEAVNQVLIGNKKHRDLILTNTQSDLLGIVVRTLEPFSTLTDMLSGDSAVTMSSIVPMLNHIKQLCAVECNDDEVSKFIKDGTWRYIASKFNSNPLNLLFSAGTMLDRRYNYVYVFFCLISIKQN